MNNQEIGEFVENGYFPNLSDKFDQVNLMMRLKDLEILVEVTCMDWSQNRNYTELVLNFRSAFSSQNLRTRSQIYCLVGSAPAALPEN